MDFVQGTLLLSQVAFRVSDSPFQLVAADSEHRVEQLEPAADWYAGWQRNS